MKFMKYLYFIFLVLLVSILFIFVNLNPEHTSIDLLFIKISGIAIGFIIISAILIGALISLILQLPILLRSNKKKKNSQSDEDTKS